MRLKHALGDFANAVDGRNGVEMYAWHAFGDEFAALLLAPLYADLLEFLVGATFEGFAC